MCPLIRSLLDPTWIDEFGLLNTRHSMLDLRDDAWNQWRRRRRRRRRRKVPLRGAFSLAALSGYPSAFW
jgi:hypothetical protein